MEYKTYEEFPESIIYRDILWVKRGVLSYHISTKDQGLAMEYEQYINGHYDDSRRIYMDRFGTISVD